MWSIGIILILGIILTLTIAPIVNNVNPDAVETSGLANFVLNGVNITIPFISTFDGWLGGDGVFTINPFFIFGETYRSYVAQNIVALSYIPEVILIPIIVLLSVAFLYGIVKVFLP
jgi:hypothetical protein